MGPADDQLQAAGGQEGRQEGQAQGCADRDLQVCGDVYVFYVFVHLYLFFCLWYSGRPLKHNFAGCKYRRVLNLQIHAMAGVHQDSLS